MFQCNSSRQNWEPLDFKVPKVEGREKKGKNKKPSMVYQQQNHAHLWDVVTITLPMPSLCNIKAHHVRPSMNIPTTQKWKLPLQTARQELVLKLLAREPEAHLYNHIWKQLLPSQGITDVCWARRRRFCSLYCFSCAFLCSHIFKTNQKDLSEFHKQSVYAPRYITSQIQEKSRVRRQI